MKTKINYSNINIDKEKLMSQFNKEASHFLNINSFIDGESLQKVIEVSNKIKTKQQTLVVIGIGGSYMGTKAVISFFNQTDNIYFLGTNLDPLSFKNEVLKFIDKDIVVNVISKSGNTLEVLVAYQLIKELLIEKYQEEYYQHIIITTNNKSGKLLEEAKKINCLTFTVPDLIGGRFSVFTVVSLLPLAICNININEFLLGFKEGLDLDRALQYSLARKEAEQAGKIVESYTIYNDNLFYLTEWLIQLFGETTGKNHHGILPINNLNTRDLHSMGQFLQEGRKIIFETVIKLNTNSSLKIKDYNITMESLNHLVMEQVIIAHQKGGVLTNVFELNLTAKDLGHFMIQMMLSAIFSALMDNDNPFNQPGVEEYKKLVNQELNKLST